MKVCEFCAGEYVRRPTEAYWQFDERKFCSRACANKGRKTTWVPDELFRPRYRITKLADGRRSGTHRAVMEAHLGEQLPPTVHVHHRDENRLNNDPSNLEVVTPAEHGLRHTKLPIDKVCVICNSWFTPDKKHRRRQQTCGLAECKSALLSRRWDARRTREVAA